GEKTGGGPAAAGAPAGASGPRAARAGAAAASLFRRRVQVDAAVRDGIPAADPLVLGVQLLGDVLEHVGRVLVHDGLRLPVQLGPQLGVGGGLGPVDQIRSEEHTSELQS